MSMIELTSVLLYGGLGFCLGWALRPRQRLTDDDLQGIADILTARASEPHEEDRHD
jgi:hypothetical protein